MDNGDLVKGFVLGAATVLVGRAILRALPSGGRPLARAVGRGGMVLAEKAQEAAAEIGEVIEDTVAELSAQDAAYEGPEEPHDPGPRPEAAQEAG